MSITYLTHFIHLWVVSMWYICQQLTLCVFLQFNMLFFVPAFLVVGSFSSQLLLRNPTMELLGYLLLLFRLFPLSHSIHYIGTVRETPSRGQHTWNKSSISAWCFCACTCSLILCVFQGTINSSAVKCLCWEANPLLQNDIWYLSCETSIFFMLSVMCIIIWIQRQISDL